MPTNADSEQPDDNNGQPRRNSTNKNQRKSSRGGSASGTKKQPNDIPEVPPQSLANINPVNAEQPSSSRKGSTDSSIPTTSPAIQQTSQPSTSTNGPTAPTGPLGEATITSGTIMQATTSQPQTFTPAGSMVVPKKSHVVETIILDHTPHLDLDIEVDRLVSVAQSQCEREKNAIKRRYEEELQKLRAINADHVNKLHKDAEKAMEAMKVKMREEFKASYDLEVVQPLQNRLASCEAEGNRLRTSLEDALAVGKENKKALEDLQNQNGSLRDELDRANDALRDREQELKDRMMKCQETEKESQQWKDGYEKLRAENEELQQRLGMLQDMESENEALRQNLFTIQEDNQHMKNQINNAADEMTRLREQIQKGEENLNLTEKTARALEKCNEKQQEMTEKLARMEAIEEENRVLKGEVEKASSQLAIQTASPRVQAPQPPPPAQPSPRIEGGAHPPSNYGTNGYPYGSLCGQEVEKILKPSDSICSVVASQISNINLPQHPQDQQQPSTSAAYQQMNRGAYDERDSLREQVRMLEGRVEELMRQVGAMHGTGVPQSQGPVSYVPMPQQPVHHYASPQYVQTAPPPPPPQRPPPPPPPPQPNRNMGDILERLGCLEETLNAFNTRHDRQIGQMQTTIQDQEHQYRNILGTFSTEIGSIKRLLGGP